MGPLILRFTQDDMVTFSLPISLLNAFANGLCAQDDMPTMLFHNMAHPQGNFDDVRAVVVK